MLCRLLVGIQRCNVRSFPQSEHHLFGNICQSGFQAAGIGAAVTPSGRGRSRVVRGCGRHLREDWSLWEPPYSHPASLCGGPARLLVFPGRRAHGSPWSAEGAQNQHQGLPTQAAIAPDPRCRLSCCQFTMESAPSPGISYTHCPSPASRLLPSSLHPCPVSSVARGQYGCQGHKTAHLKGWVGLVPGDNDSQRSHRVGPNWVWILPRPIHQPGRWHLSPAWGCQPPSTHSSSRRPAVPILLPRPLPAPQSIAITWPMLCQLPSPSAASAGGTGVHS